MGLINANNAALMAAIAAASAATTAAIAGLQARMNNQSALLSVHVLHPVPNANQTLPANAQPAVWFPATRNDLENMSMQRATLLCAFYGIAAGGANVERKRLLVAQAINVRPHGNA